MSWTSLYLVIGAVATLLAGISTPIFRAIAWKTDFLDKPLGQAHKRHGKATPLLGGAAMLTAWLITLVGGYFGALWLRPHLPPDLANAVAGLLTPRVQRLLLVITTGGLALAVMGAVDDRRPMGPLRKLILQILICAGIALCPDLQVTLFWENPAVKWLMTLCWFTFIINAFNFLDNMDGLAAGLAFIASTLFAVVGALQQQYFVAALGACTAGVTLGFYIYNCSPASIFMGDSGSHFLGYLLGVQGVLTKYYLDDISPTVGPVFIPALILGLPIFDIFAVCFIRWRLHKPIYSGDHNHISHRFLKLGLSRALAVLLVHLLALALGLGALPLLWLPSVGVWLVFGQAMLALVTIVHWSGYRREKAMAAHETAKA
jgi:UDP-GlcNAc:undecaprenyl-phosphate/decaprenyl-phosphate GlcNAc-1-phosphate transferase